MRLDLSRLKVFYIIAQAGNLVKASAQLHITQPALSRQIQMLEHELQTKVFKRTPRGFKLTVEGEKVFVAAKEIIEKAEHLEKTLKDNSDEPQGRIVVKTTPSMGETNLTYHLLPFLERYPLINLKVITGIENIDVHEADVAIRTYIPHQPDLEQLYLRTLHLKLWASKEYLKKFGTPRAAKDLDQHRILAFDEDKHNSYSNTNWILYAGRDSNLPPREPFYQINSIEGLHNAAAQGFGIVHLTKEFVKYKGSLLKEILPTLEGPKLDIYYIFPKRLKKFKRIMLLYDHLRKHLEK